MGKNVAISGYYGFDNFGDEAILACLVDHLRSRGSNVAVISNNPKNTSAMFQVFSVKNFNLLAVFALLSNSDVLISGGGSLLQDVTSFKSLFYYSTVIKLANALGKKVVIFAQGIGPLQRPRSEKIVKEILSKAALITVRDEKSLERVKNWGFKASLVNDPVFSLDLPRHEQNSGIVGVQLRDCKTMNDVLLNKLADKIVSEFPDKKIELYAFQKSIDLKICKIFEKMLKIRNPEIQVEILHSLSQVDFIIKISKLDYMIAMRFHAVLVAIKCGVKTLAINYDAKVMKLAYEALIPILTMNGDDDYDTAFDKMKSLDVNRLLSFSNSKPFEWNLFDSIIT